MVNQLFKVFLLCTPILLSSCGIFAPSPRKAVSESLKQAPYDAIIVPGVPHYGEHWDTIMMIRVHWSKHLYDLGYTKNIIYSGGAVYSPYTEAKVMALYGEALGIPKENIFVEGNAEHSTENVVYSYQLAKQKGLKHIALATDPFQTRNLYPFIKKFEIPVKTIPIIFDILRPKPKPEPDIDVSLARKDNFTSLPDRQGRLQRLRGTFGRYIVWEEEDLKKERFKKRFKKQNRLKP